MSATQKIFKINGFVDPRNNVWDNIEKISSAASAWTTYDTTTGKWSLVINESSASVKTFNDTNIIGEIVLTKAPLSQAYTKGKFKYANKDQVGKFDSIEYQFDEIDTGDFLDYDYRSIDNDNKIEITNELVNDYVQADVLLNRELKQSRRRTNIEFFTDFSALDLLAGDVITVEADIFENQYAGQQSSRKFRVIEVEETDGDGGEILLKIIGVDYSDEDYELTGFSKFTRLRADPMPPINGNTTVQNNIAEGDGVKVGNALATDAGRTAITSAGIPVLNTVSGGFTNAEMVSALGSGTGAGTPATATWSVGATIKNMQITFQQPQATYNYTVDSVSKSITAAVPCKAELQYSTDNSVFTTLQTQYMEWSTYLSVFNLGNAAAGYYRVKISSLGTFDLNATNNAVTVNSGITTFFTNSDGFAATIAVMAFLN
jgi:hypothetical protein